MILLSHNRLFLVICLPPRFQNRSCPAMCSCNFIIPYPLFDVNEIQHVFLAVFVVFIGWTPLVLFVFRVFIFFSIHFVFLFCHTWIYIEIPLVKRIFRHMFMNSKRGVNLCIFLICIHIPSPAATARNAPSPIWPGQPQGRASGFSESQTTVPELWLPELLPNSGALPILRKNISE